jgi:hypothetical protein
MFFASAILYGVAGMVLGLHMAISHDHGQMPTHAHIMVIGWLSFFAFGIFYHLFRDAEARKLARVHFWLAQLSMLGLAIGLGLTYGGQTHLEPIAAISAIGYAISFLVFAVVAWPVLFER